MPELPEVQTTVTGLKQHVLGLRICDVWTDYKSSYFKGSETIKDPLYFKRFKKLLINKKIISAERRAKNILIGLDNGKTILIHMKMTGHLLYGHYLFKVSPKNNPWQPIEPESLKDPFNRHIHFVITFNNGRRLALSDMRKFAKVTLIDTESLHDSEHLNKIGPEPLEKNFTLQKFNERLNLKSNGKIKQVLMNQSIIAGIGNIYADESLWRAGIHPATIVKNVPANERKNLFNAIKKNLSHGIKLGGDSMSDYRNIDGEKGKFQEQHSVYQRAGMKCLKKGCGGIITRIVVGGRGTHFCNEHQSLS